MLDVSGEHRISLDEPGEFGVVVAGAIVVQADIFVEDLAGESIGDIEIFYRVVIALVAIGFVAVVLDKGTGEEDYVFEAEMFIDGKSVERAKLPTKFIHRRFTLFWRYQLSPGRHKVRLKVLNPTDKAKLNLNYVVVYGDKPFRARY